MYKFVSERLWDTVQWQSTARLATSTKAGSQPEAYTAQASRKARAKMSVSFYIERIQTIHY